MPILAGQACRMTCLTGNQEGDSCVAKYILKRLLLMIPIMLGVTWLIFSMLYLTPGSPAAYMAGDGATPEAIAELEVQLGLDQPYFVRFFNFLKDLILHGDLGTSYTTKLPVLQMIRDAYPNTLVLASVSIVFSAFVGISIGIVSAVKQYSLVDNISMSVLIVLISMPTFWLGLLLILLFSLKLNWLPSSGLDSMAQLILPTLTISASNLASIARMTRSSMLEIIRSDYIVTARAKGQREWVVIMHHALRNALLPVISTIGLSFGMLLGGSIVTESIFSISGLGKLLIDAIKARNYPVVQGGVLCIAIVFCLINLAVDLIYAFVDPRVRSQYVK